MNGSYKYLDKEDDFELECFIIHYRNSISVRNMLKNMQSL